MVSHLDCWGVWRWALQVRNAILICDVEILPEFAQDLYPFPIWYGNRSRKIRKAHFIDDRVPLRLGDITGKTRALLWHRDQTAVFS